MGKNVTRLYSGFQPENYKLSLTPDKSSMTFVGTVTITGKKSGRPSQRLTFHQNGLNITSATVHRHDKKGDETIEISRINHHKSADEVRLHAEKTLYPGKYTVTLEFEGKITRPMNGIYPCFYTSDTGDEEIIIATQFESHHAREVFPCIDEPEAKATFDLTLTTPKGEVVSSNTPVLTQTSTGELTTTVFETTPKMSTYLLAFVYGNLAFKESKTSDGVIVRAYATPDKIDTVDFSLEVATKTLEFYNEYFGITYPLKKCDMIALPDFASGAMENWGCITYREQCMLVDPENSTLATKQYVAMVVAHELAHQWFGNLVTMRWWTDLWLNEGFASWIEYLAVDHLFPEWDMWTQFTVDEQHRALKLDALEHTHPIEVPVNHPDEIRTIFDTISYSKGASVIHMLNAYLGEDDFRKGLQHYLKLHEYGNTDTVDLWNALESASGKPVKAFMHAWTTQPGFPVVHAKVTNNELQLSQERFYLNPEHTKDETVQWPIPLMMSGDTENRLLSESAATFATSTKSTKLNTNQSGFYRTAYDPEELAKLGHEIDAGALSPLDRLGVLSDVFENAKAGESRTKEALEFLSHFRNEDNNAVWDVISSALVSTRSVMDSEDLRESMKPFILSITNKQLMRLGWQAKDNESHFDQLLRPTILGLSAGADDKNIVSECLKRFEAMTRPEDIHPDLRSVIYMTAVRHGDTQTFEKLLNIHEKSNHSEERTTLAAALCSFKQPELIKRALGLITSDSVRLQDVSYWVAYSFMNRYARDATWDWMKSEWKWLGDNLGNDLSFYRFPMFAANAYSNRDFLESYREFFLPKMAPAFERSIHQGIEVLQWQSAWKERDLEQVESFFKSHQ